MEPLKITFEINGAMVLPDRPLHLDALLAYVYTQSRMFMLEAPYSKDDLIALGEDLPIERAGEGDNWFYKASALQPVGKLEHTSRFMTTRHSDVGLAEAMAKKEVVNRRDTLPHPHMSHKSVVDLSRGALRNSLIYQHIAVVDKMVSYCIGDKDSLINDLSSGYITHLGKMRRMGLGLIKSISVEVDEEAKVKWQERVRPYAIEGDIQVSSPIRAPYWSKEKDTLCFMPSYLI